MEVRWWWYAAVSVAAIAMTLLIVGLPADSPPNTLRTADAAVATASPESEPEPAGATVPPETSAVAGSTTSITTTVAQEPATTAAEPESAAATESRRRRSPTTPASSGATTTTVEVVDDLDPAALADPASLHVVVANGSGVDGEAGRFAEGVRLLGYPDVSITNGDQQIESTRVFFVDPFWLEAIRLADEFGLDRTTVALLEEAPGFESVGDDPDLVVFLGRDRAA